MRKPTLVYRSKARRSLSKRISVGPKVVSKSKYAYADDWAEKSYQFRKSVGWTCKRCKWSPRKTANRKFLHAHHGVRKGAGGSDARANLTCECLGCHAKEHKHMQALKIVKFFNDNKHWL